MIYDVVAVGGTFDRLHFGHKEFLRFAFSKGKKVIIGLTSDEYIGKYKPSQRIESFEDRKKMLIAFLENEKNIERARIIEINDGFGPLISNEFTVGAIVVTNESLAKSVEINVKRKELGLTSLEIINMPLVKTGDFPISSTSIRMGKMSLHGDLILPDSLRKALQKPFGPIIKDLTNIHLLDPEKIVTVGDETTRLFNKEKINQKISVIDFVVNRKKKYSKITELGFEGSEIVFKAKNPSGNITRELWEVVEEVIDTLDKYKRLVICLEGEEDLAVIPLVLFLPENYYIFYGQPGVGIVRIDTGVVIKNKFKDIISHFENKKTLGS